MECNTPQHAENYHSKCNLKEDCCDALSTTESITTENGK